MDILKTDLQTVTNTERSLTVKLLTPPVAMANEAVSHAVAVRNSMPPTNGKLQCDADAGSCQQSKDAEKEKGKDLTSGRKPVQAEFQKLVFQTHAYRLWAAKRVLLCPDLALLL